MKCAKCEGVLQKVNLGEVEVDQCPECSGIWFDFGELDRILEEDDISKLRDNIDNSAAEDVLRSACPACGGAGKMIQCASLQVHGLHIDTCKVCYGQWLDGGELEKLKQKGILESVAAFFKGLL